MDPKIRELENKLYNLLYPPPPTDPINSSVGGINGGVNGANAGQSAVQAQGREYAHTLYPDEIEFYACAFELINGDGDTEEYFLFPIMPTNYSENNVSITNIEKTMAGVVVSGSPSFVPIDITFSGNFGRTFKRINTDVPTRAANSQYRGNQTSNLSSISVKPVFSHDYKTGYGCYKILENILIKSSKQDGNFNPYQLYFYNLSLNHNYLIEYLSISPNQNYESSNMIWNYNLTLKAVAPASSANKNLKSSLKFATDFNKKVNNSNNNAGKIDKVLDKKQKKTGKKKSRVQQIFERQASNRALNLLNNSQRSALTGLLQLAQNPRYDGEFVIDDSAITIGEGILNQF